ncbi:MFS transporter [Nocardia pseudobrasiliensis]|uniref:Putative MFS family arabinose efflux permease n=1 Tax=Nocardia pseudobrasiliensis TaxID=45979 RepID=A0A370IA17_9NOCA|nr:MFS transporter [Nocardia pseudobrasiliensis]RDI66971.1 putative MFS family arabinose efflux permease [Nocardia pseudobrasiliensis]
MTRNPSAAVLVYAFAVVMLGTTMPTSMYALYGAKLHFSVLTTTVVFATYAVGVIAALVGFGHWSDTLGRRPLLASGLVLAAASSLVFLTAGPLWQLLIGRALSGLSAGIFTGTATVAIVEAAPPARRDHAAVIATIANMGGLGLGPVFSGVLVQYLRWPLQLSFAVHLGLLALAAIGLLRVRETVRGSGKPPAPRGLSVPAEVRGAFVPAAIATFAGFAVLGLFTAVVPTFLAEMLGVRNHAVAGVVVALIFAGSALAQVAARPLRTSAALIGGCAILVAGVLLILLALLLTSVVWLVLGAFVAGAGQGITFSKSVRSVADAAPPERRAEVTSTLFVVSYLAISVPVVGEGLAVRLWGLRTAGISFAAAVAVLASLALVASWAVDRRRERIAVGG